MPGFIVPANQPSSAHLVIQLVCALIAWLSLWRFGASALLLVSTGIGALAFLGFSHRRNKQKWPCSLLVNNSGSFVATTDEQTYDAHLYFALRSTNQILLRARVTIDGRATRQEWLLKRTDNEALWRLGCQWALWLSSQGETKKRH